MTMSMKRFEDRNGFISYWFDNREISEAFYPTLSTVALPLSYMGND